MLMNPVLGSFFQGLIGENKGCKFKSKGRDIRCFGLISSGAGSRREKVDPYLHFILRWDKISATTPSGLR